MAILRLSEIKEMGVEQMDEKIKELTTDLGKMRSQVRSGGAPENSGKAREIRRTIARLETIKAQKMKEAPKEKTRASTKSKLRTGSSKDEPSE